MMKLHERLDISLEAVDQTMADVILSDRDLPADSIIRDNVLRMIRAGGKRLRPMLVLIGGRFGSRHDEKQAKLMRTAVLLEYMHMASLVHDDIIDEADMRRGDLALHRRTDEYTAALIADYMIARALEWTIHTPDGADEGQDEEDHQVSGHLAALASQLCLGEYGQMRNAYRFDISLRDYLQKTRQKTALLMASCLRAGAEVTGADVQTQNLLYRIGDALGMAFQIQDDILDLVQTDEKLGKPAGADLRSGNITLPVLYALEIPGLGEDIRELGPDTADTVYEDIIERIRASSALARSEEIRDVYLERARRAIGKLEHYPAHQDLLVLLDYLSNRPS